MTRVAAVRRADAHRRAQRVRDNVMAVNELLETLDEIHEQQDWMALGYKSWADYYEGEFGALKLNAEQRGRVVAVMAAAGVSKRRIGKALGISDSTVRLDVKGARNRALPSAEPQVKDSGDASGKDADVSGQAAADELYAFQSSVDGAGVRSRQELGHADAPAGDAGSTGVGVPGNPTDSSLARDEPGPVSPVTQPSTDPSVGEEPEPPPVAAGETFDSSAAQNLTEGSAPYPSTGPVLSPAAVPGVAEAGDREAEEESEARTEDSFSADPTFMDAIDALWTALDRLDYDATGPTLLDEEMSRIDQLPAVVENAAKLLRRSRES